MRRALAGATLLLSTAAVGQEARVAVVADPADPMAQRLAAELQAVGLVAVPLDRGAPADGVVATVEVVSPGRLRVVVVDPDGAPLSSDLTWTAEDAAAESLVGVQAVELLRAGLLETRDLGRRGDRMSLVELAVAGARASAGSALSVGLLGTAGTVSRGPVVAVDLGLRVPVVDRLVAVAELSTPIARAAYRGEAGAVYLAVSRLGGGARWRLRDPDADWVPDVGLAAGVGWFGFAYEPAPQFLGGDDRSFLRGWGGARAGLSGPRVGPVGGRLDLRLDAAPPVEVALDGTPAGGWGPISAGAALAVDVVW